MIPTDGSTVLVTSDERVVVVVQSMDAVEGCYVITSSCAKL